MNATIGTVIAFLSLVIGGLTLYLLGRSNARENKRQQDEATTRAVLNATQPLLDRLAERDRDIADKDAALYQTRQDKRDLQTRVHELEDQLRRSGS